VLLNFANTILILFLLSGSHNHYTSITNANLNTQNGKIEISVELTAHDLENYFISEQKVNLKLGSSKEFANANELIESYINNNLIFKINNKSTTLTLIGKEVNNDESLLLYLQGNIPKNIKTVTVENKLLISLFNDQQNILHLDGCIKESYTFSTKNKIKTFNKEN